jgi:hypothetical protein
MTSLARVGALLLGTASCGLISSDITAVTFPLPAKSFQFDSASLNIPAGNTTSVPCGAGQLVTNCCAPPAPLPAPNCSMPGTTIDCPPSSGGVSVCTAHVTVSQSVPMNLGQESPQLAGKSSFANLSIKQISYAVDSNSLNIDVPPVIIYLAAEGVTDPAQATKFGTVPAIAAGKTPSGNVVLESNAAATFSSVAHDLSKPFNFIAATTVDVPSGSPTPSGAIQITVAGMLSASL